MSRNYEKEYEWQKNKYHDVKVRIEKKKYEKVKEKLGNKPIATWLKEKIDEFIGYN